MRRLLATCLLLTACEGVVSDLGEAEAPPSMTNPSAPHISQLTCAPLSGPEPLDVTCTLQVEHPKNLATACVIDPGDGRAASQVAGCVDGPQQVHFTFTKAGQFVVRAVATSMDSGDGISASVAVTVEPQPNAPPTIDSFEATPKSGTAPVKTTLTWAIADEENDALTCAIDGVAVDCKAPGFPFTTTMLGATTVTLTVTDQLGRMVSKTLTVTAREAVGDVRVTRAEWGQSVLKSDLKLVAGKPALLRLFVLGDKAGLAGVEVEVEASVGGTVLGTVKATGPASPPVAEAIDKLAEQYQVTTPVEWMVPNLTVKVTVDPTDAVAETDETNNTLSLTPAMGLGNVVELTAVPVVQGGRTGAVTNLDATLTRIWPVKSVSQQQRAAYTYGGAALTGGNAQGWSDLLGDLAAVKRADGSRRNYYGFVKVNYQAGVAGIGYIGQGTALGRDDSMETAAHELGHNFGRQHAPCGGVAGPDGAYPYPNANIGSWGYDATAKKLMAPTAFKDLMSYCQPEWVSDYNYRAVQQFLEARPATNETTSAPFVASLLVMGSVDGDAVRVRAVHRLTARPEALRDGGELQLELLGADGRVTRVPVVLDEPAEGSERHFVALVADPGPLLRLEVRRGAKVLMAQAATFALAEKPTLTSSGGDSRTLQWSGAGTAAVSYVGETSRTTLALGLTGGRAEVSTAGLALEAGGRFEVSVSDGLNSQTFVIR